MAKSRRRLRSSSNTTRSNRAEPWADGSIGEGRSKSIYIPPTTHDTAVLIPFFNPAQFKRPLKNLLYVMKILADQQIPCFVVECVFFGREPEVKDAALTVRSNSAMFYKEQLLNLLEKKVPEKYTKLVLMDSDIIFNAPDWLDQISYKLNSVDVIQPFLTACWLYPDNRRIRAKKYSYAYAIVKNIAMKSLPSAYHPGFVWAMKRSTFRSIGGLYDKAIAGNGDVMFTFSLINKIDRSYLIRYAPCILDTWNGYNETVQKIQPKVGYLNMDVYHLFHGLNGNRQYATRHSIIKGALQSGWDEQITKNADGLYEFKDKRLSDGLLKYFTARDEDLPLSKAMRPLRRVPTASAPVPRASAPVPTASVTITKPPPMTKIAPPATPHLPTPNAPSS